VAPRDAADTVVRPGADGFVTPIVSALPVPVHHGTALKGTELNQPRNLAKPVTVK
jgi:glucosamine 6-phosphate synthetase-like amidotransferase/phosphosugar isomerase protein